LGKQRTRTKPRPPQPWTDQPAMLARPSRVLETMAAGVTVRCMEDADPIAGMGLSRLQIDAAEYLRGLWADALPAVEMPGSYGSGAGHGGQRHMTHDQMLAAGRAWQDYRKAMDHLTAQAGQHRHDAVRAAVVRMEARAHAGYVREGLAVLARHWRMR